MLPDSSLSGTNVRLYWIGWLDFNGEPVRATTLPYDYTPTGTGDPDLDGATFLSIDHALVDVSPVVHGKGGSDTLTVTLRGLPGKDDDLLTAIDTPANWQGRDARLWHGVFSSSGVPSAPVAYYTGWMNRVSDSFVPASGDEPASRIVSVQIENYLALLTTARNRTYQHQTEHDAGDLSPLRMRSAANGTTGSGFVGISGGGAMMNNPDRQYVQQQ